MGLTREDQEYVYLSDGGRFENLGIYEMVRHRITPLSPPHPLTIISLQRRGGIVSLSNRMVWMTRTNQRCWLRSGLRVRGSREYCTQDLNQPGCPNSLRGAAQLVAAPIGWVRHIKPGYH